MSADLVDIQRSIDKLTRALTSDEYQEPINTLNGEIQATLEWHAEQITDAVDRLTEAVRGLTELAYPPRRPSLLRQLLLPRRYVR